jgi:spermidine synthase
MGSRFRQIEFLLFLSVFTIATCGLVYELVAGTLASYLLGDSVRQFSFIIGIYLFAMGVGSYLAKYLPDSRLIERFIDIEILVGLVGGLSSSLLFALFQRAAYFELLLYLLVFLTGLLVGLELPLLMNILRERVEFKDLVSRIFTFDYIGALIASVAFPLVLMPHLGLVRTSLMFGMLNVGVALAVCILLRSELLGFEKLRFKALAALALLGVVFIFSEKIITQSETNAYWGEKVIYSKSTSYQRITLTRNKTELRLYLNGNLQFSTRDEYRYHESLVHPAMSKAPAVGRVLILGGGDGLAAREVLRYPDVQEITLVDLDPQMTDLFAHNPLLRAANGGSLTDPKVRVVNQDAFVWLRTNATRYDVVIADFPDPSNYSIGKLYSNALYQTLRQSVTDSALVVIQSTSPYYAPKSFWCINQTVLSSFANTWPYHVVVPSFGEWGFVLATPMTQFDATPQRRRVSGLRFYDYDFEALTTFGQDMQYRETDVNRLDNQVLVRYFIEEWGK